MKVQSENLATDEVNVATGIYTNIQHVAKKHEKEIQEAPYIDGEKKIVVEYRFYTDPKITSGLKLFFSAHADLIPEGVALDIQPKV